MKDLCRVPKAIAIIVSIVTIIGLFLPYISATEDYASYLKTIKDQKIYESADMTAGDMREVSLFEYAKVYYQAGEEIFKDKNAGIFYSVMFGSPAILGLMLVLFAARKKPILMFLFSILLGLMLYLINWDVADRGIMPNYNRVWGIAHSMYYPCVAVLSGCSIWMFIVKRKMKRSVHQEEN